MRFALILMPLYFAACAFGQSTGNRVTVVADTLQVHEEMSAASPVVAELHKGDEVTIRSSIAQSGETWCSISLSGPGGRSGSVPCASLKREPTAQVTRVAGLAPSRSVPLLPTTRAAHIPKAIRSAIYLAPLGGFRDINLSTLVEYYKQKFGLEVQTLPAIPFDSASYDPIRKQYVAERLRELIDRSVPAELNNTSVLVIGITEGDIYMTGENYPWVLGLRSTRGRAVISAARMDLKHFVYNTPVDFDILHRNLAKMTSRYIGLLYYGLGFSQNPLSVVRQYVLGVDDLEAIGEEF